jgi:hypothetical protein
MLIEPASKLSMPDAPAEVVVVRRIRSSVPANVFVPPEYAGPVDAPDANVPLSTQVFEPNKHKVAIPL